MRSRRIMVSLILLVSLLPWTGSLAQETPDFVKLITADTVMAHVEALAVEIGSRPAGSEAEAAAAGYIAAQLEGWGYEVELQEFDYGKSGSQNVVATLAGRSEQTVVVGAHYDSVPESTGAGDNGSGVAAMLAAAEVLKDEEPAYRVTFVAFGAEEVGSVGSDEFVTALGDDIENVIAMINVDSVGVGTTLNVYAGAVVTWDEEEEEALNVEGGPTWVRDVALDLAAEMNLPFGTTPDDTWGGFTGDWSDHYPFVLAGVPVVYFEAWDWQAGGDTWWGQETADGDVMHTPDDNYDHVVPEKVEMAAELVAATTYAIATGVASPEE